MDARGADTQDARVLIDGEQVAERLDGQSIEVDPGPHDVRVVAPDGKESTQRLLLAQGEKHRAVAVDFTVPVPKKPAPKPPIPVSAVILGGVGVVALGSFAFWGVLGKNLQADLEETCAPRCQQADADVMRRDFVLADVSLGIGIVALGAAALIAVTSRSAPPAEATVAVQPRRRPPGFSVPF
jgi:hypothetical protein